MSSNRWAKLLASLAFLAGLVAPSATLAAPCANFVDVEDTSPFCASVQWLKNRAVTTGCAIANSYCPDAPVSRLAMSAFMNRLGLALVPVYVTQYGSGVNLDVDSDPLVCSTVDRSSPFARRAHGVAVIGAGNPAGGALDFMVMIVESTDSGASWSAVTPPHSVTVRPNNVRTASVLMPPRPIDVGTNYRYAVMVSRVPGSSTTADASSWQCQLQLRFDNRNPSSAPFDDQ
jgi:hypothetical protein